MRITKVVIGRAYGTNYAAVARLRAMLDSPFPQRCYTAKELQKQRKAKKSARRKVAP
jgi:hypothetical protein